MDYLSQIEKASDSEQGKHNLIQHHAWVIVTVNSAYNTTKADVDSHFKAQV